MAQILEISPGKDRSRIARAAELHAAGELDQALAIAEEYLLEDVNDPQAIVLVAAILKDAKKLTLAYQLAKRGTDLRPDKCEVWGVFGLCAQFLWRMDEAAAAYRKALSRSQTDEQRALYESNLGSVHLDCGRFSKAEEHLQRSLSFVETDTSARHNYGLALLARREWKEGWPYYSSSVGKIGRVVFKYKNPPEPTWDGDPSQRIVVFGEQGLGDEICAASMLPDAIRTAKHVIVDCDKRLEGLFRRSFPEASVYGTRYAKPGEGKWKETKEDFDASIAGFELGRFFRNSNEDFPGEPYLQPCPVRTASWKGYFREARKPVIGIAWSGGTPHNAGLYRRLPLSQWKPIFDAVNAHWISLQYKDASQDIEGTPVRQFPWATLTKDYDDTAALVASCDLVIGMQTSVNHLAGALGVPCWALIPSTSQWRYGETYTDMPWYRSMKLYRETSGWHPVVQQIAKDLHERFR
jgi:tetratricopeptide (TPR) repeat protein